MNPRGLRSPDTVFARSCRGNRAEYYGEGMKSRVHPKHKTRCLVANWWAALGSNQRLPD